MATISPVKIRALKTTIRANDIKLRENVQYLLDKNPKLLNGIFGELTQKAADLQEITDDQLEDLEYCKKILLTFSRLAEKARAHAKAEDEEEAGRFSGFGQKFLDNLEPIMSTLGDYIGLKSEED